MTRSFFKPRFSSFKYLVACAAFMAGCDFDIGGGTEGREGEIEFSFAGNAFLECFLGCDVDRPIAVGAGSTLVILDDTPDKSFTVRVPEGVLATYQEDFECVGKDDPAEPRAIEPFETCREDEQRTAIRTVEIVPSQPGTVLVEVLEDGELVDAIEVEARAPAGAVIMSDSEGTAIDALVVKAGESFNISADLIDAEGSPLYFDILDQSWTVGDESVAEVEWYSWLSFGGETSATFVATAPGTTTLRFEALGISREIPASVE